MAVWQVQLSEVRRQIDPDSKSSCREGSVAEVGARPTDAKHAGVSRAQSSWAGVGDEAAVVSQVILCVMVCVLSNLYVDMCVCVSVDGAVGE